MDDKVCVIITRPVGSHAGLLRAARARGADALALPGLSLRAPLDQAAARAALGAALGADKWIVTSPAAVRFAQRLQPLLTRASVFALGAATAKALQRAGLRDIYVPKHADSESVLALPALQSVHGQRIAMIGAAGGRGLLQASLAERGARIESVTVYRRVPARLDQRHWRPLQRLSVPPVILLSSAASLAALQAAAPSDVWTLLQAGIAVVSSERLDMAAAQAGFVRRLRARSALTSDMLDAVPCSLSDFGRPGCESVCAVHLPPILDP